MTRRRFTPRQTTDGWRVYDTILTRFAPGFGAKCYQDAEECRITCDRLNAS